MACWVLGAAALPAWALPSFQEVRQAHRSSETLVLSREGEVLQRQRVDTTVRRGDWVPLADMSAALRTALVLSEDKRFFEHSGVDWAAASAAAWGNLWNQRTRGASTITMQLAGLLDDDWRQGPGGRSVVQKIGQTVAAQVLDRRWRKDQILEAYLNLVPFRGEVVGIDALARTLFGKAPHGLLEDEAALAAALVRAPNAQPAQVAQRACGVLQQMRGQGVAGPKPDCTALDLLAHSALQRRAWAASEGVAPHAARRALAQVGAGPASAALRTTLSAPLQRRAVQLLAQHLTELGGRNVQDGAIVVIDNASGEILAWVGSSGALSGAAEVDGVLALRQPGSTLKPFLYAQALQQRRLTAASLIEDSPTQIATPGGLYIPQNYDRQFKGWVSARTALAASLNVPAVRTLVMVSPDAFFKLLADLGLPLAESAGYYGYSLALGSSEVALLNLTNAYRALANGGRYSPVVPLTGAGRQNPPVFKPVLDAGAAFIVGDILSDGNARARTFGTDSVLATRTWTAVKTGTSKDMRDNWAVGWSGRYTVGVWVGNASGAAMHDVSGTSGAAPIWAALMAQLHARAPSRAPAPPRSVVRQAVRFGPGQEGGTPLEAARAEWFLPGTQQTWIAINTVAYGADPLGVTGQKTSKKSKASPTGRLGNPETTPSPTGVRIATPVPGTIIALDPDIPPTRQRLQLAATPGGAFDLRWRIDGNPLARGPQAAWLPWPGQHVVQLTDAQGQVLDEVRIEVRGAGVKGKPR